MQAGTHSPTEPYQVLETLLGFRNPIRFVTTLPGSCNPSNPRHRGAQAPLMDLAVSGCPQGPPVTLAKIPNSAGFEPGSQASQPAALTIELQARCKITRPANYIDQLRSRAPPGTADQRKRRKIQFFLPPAGLRETPRLSVMKISFFSHLEPTRGPGNPTRPSFLGIFFRSPLCTSPS